MFKSIDERLAELGFKKVSENRFGAEYTRYNAVHDFTQRVCLLHKLTGKHIIQSYDKDLFDERKIGNTCVGLTMLETKLFYKKMKQMGWKPVK